MALFGVLAPPEECPQVTAAELRQAAAEAVSWFARNQNPDGTWLYLWDEQADAEGDEIYNGVRHAGAIMGLYQAAAADVDGALASADRGMRWVERPARRRRRLGGHQGRGTVACRRHRAADLRPGGTPPGHRRRAPRPICCAASAPSWPGRSNPPGRSSPTTTPTRAGPPPALYSKYYTGEAYWALGRLHRLLPDEGFGEAADRVGRYLATRRDDVEDLFPPIPDHWAAYGLAETVAFPRRLTADEVAYARRQAGLWAAQVRWVSQQAGPWGSAGRAAPTSPGAAGTG